MVEELRISAFKCGKVGEASIEKVSFPHVEELFVAFHFKQSNAGMKKSQARYACRRFCCLFGG